MPLPAADLAALSRLLDQALEVDAAQREAWLEALPPADRHLQPMLRAAFTEHQNSTGFLGAMPALAATAVDGAVAHAGDMVGPYRLIREIGHGGMGAVWLAQRADGVLERQVALKLPRLVWAVGLAKRMAREREIGAKLEHPNIARLYDAGVDEQGRPYLAMEYVDGVAIDAWCREKKLGVRETLQLVVQVARALAHAHGRLVVHRDLKPGNVLVTADGQPHLLDFGIAMLLDSAADASGAVTVDQARVMTPHYASPEQVSGDAVTVQSDVYSLGVLTYELLTGRLPHEPKRKTRGALEQAILEDEPAPPSSRVDDRAHARRLRGDVDAIVGKALSREPARRYTTADAMAVDIERHVAGETVMARPDSTLYRMGKVVRRHWIGIAAALVVMVAVLGAAAAVTIQARRATLAAEREREVKAFLAETFRMSTRVASNGEKRSALSTIEEGAELIQQRFAGQPELQAELFGVLGGLYRDMGAHTLAAKYIARQVALLVRAEARPHLQAAAWLELAKVKLEPRERTGERAEEPQRIDEAADHLRKVGELLPRGALPPEARLLSARVKLEKGANDDAQKLIDEAAASIDPHSANAAALRAQVLEAQASLLQVRGRAAESVASLRKAIEAVQAAEGQQSITAATMQLRLARSELFRTALAKGSDAEARAMQSAATNVLRQRGGAHAVRAEMEHALFWGILSDVGLATFDEAELAIRSARQALEKSAWPVPDLHFADIDAMLGVLLAGRGDLARGLPLLEAGSAAALELQTSSHGTAYVLARVYAWAGQHELAERWGRESLAFRQGMPGFATPLLHEYAFIAENFMMQGRHADALAALDEAEANPAVRSDTGLSPLDARQDLNLRRAKVRLEMGDARIALELLRDYTPPEPDESEGFETTLGIATCAAGSAEEGLSILRSELARTPKRGQWHASAPRLGWIEAHIGLCELNAKRPALAAEAAAKARSVFAAQPDVSPYYEAPLWRLDSALGTLGTGQTARRGKPSPRPPRACAHPVLCAPVAPHTHWLPNQWRPSGLSPQKYDMVMSQTAALNGQHGVMIRSTSPVGRSGFGTIVQAATAAPWRGKRIALRSWMKTEGADSAQMWLRIDGPDGSLFIDNMYWRRVVGTTGWQRYEIVMDVPQEAEYLAYGVMLVGRGQVDIDDVQLEVVPHTVQTTGGNDLRAEKKDGYKPPQTVLDAPANLGFEDPP